MFKINNVYRFQIILKYKDYNLVKEHLKYLDDVYKLNSKVNIEIDEIIIYLKRLERIFLVVFSPY